MSKPRAVVRWKTQKRWRFSITGAPGTKPNWFAAAPPDAVVNGQNHMSITSP